MQKNTKCFLLLFTIIFLFMLYSCSSTEFSLKDSNNQIYSAEKLLVEGDKAYNNKNYELALKYYQAVLEYYHDDTYNSAWANYEIGYVYYRLKEYEKAKKYFYIVINKYKSINDAVSLSKLMISRIESLLKNDSSKVNNNS